MVLLAAVALTLAIGDHPDAVVIALVIAVNTTVGVIQETRADRAVAALSAMTAPTVRVLCAGTERVVSSVDIVPGDVLLLAEGDIVPADAVLDRADALLVDESMLTGESVPVDKEVRSGCPDTLQIRAGVAAPVGLAAARLITRSGRRAGHAGD
ncbi:HAD-IC family P-type ATPase [Kitasatospora sp. NPDC048540]|uniref:HAD-IC family P-type ATPase n=1 Tax=Kitasatospora sp. NPDC048540 TaxID=3155634 RepID=UPI0033CE6513